MKKIVSIISIFAIILSATQFVLADYSDDTTITDGQFAYKKGTNNILAYVGTTGICEIPENTTLKGLTPSWAKDAAPITKLIINDNVDINMIISGELVNLNKLKEVEIKEGVTEIPYQFLKGCNNLEKITLPSTIEIIDDEAFSECSKLSTLDLNDGLQSIGRYAFSETTLSGNLNIPDTVTHMDVTAFTDCGNLDKVHMSNNIECEKDKKYCYWFPQTDIKEINIPDTMLNCTNCYFHGDEITFNSDMTVNIYNKVQNSNWCDLKYLKGKTDRTDTKLLADGNYTIAGGAKAMRKLYEDNPDMTAVFISNYEMTVGAMMEINDLGIKVPEQLSVIGFDNMDFARAVVPRLTIVTPPTEEIGQAAANLLLSHLEDKDETSDKTSDKIETTETIWLKTGFVEGESVADIS